MSPHFLILFIEGLEGVKWELGFVFLYTGKMGFTALGLRFNHWERHKPFLKGKWDFYPFTIFDFII